ncbi:hypothetical protein BH10PSE13_BH10PSE13_16480 [soil metagenome]
MARQTGSLTTGVMLASFSAGPIYLSSVALAGLYGMIPQPVIVPASLVLGFCLMIVPATIVGMFIAVPLCTIGGLLMTAMGKVIAPARGVLGWMAAGGSIGAAFVILTNMPDGPTCFAFIVTSMLCAGISHRHIEWDRT